VSAERAPLVAVGEVITVPEGDYQLGRGTLRLRVVHVPQLGGDPRYQTWIQLMGVEVGADGVDGRHRTVLVRVAALEANPPDPNPPDANPPKANPLGANPPGTGVRPER
jgi:hypothetical protein